MRNRGRARREKSPNARPCIFLKQRKRSHHKSNALNLSELLHFVRNKAEPVKVCLLARGRRGHGKTPCLFCFVLCVKHNLFPKLKQIVVPRKKERQVCTYFGIVLAGWSCFCFASRVLRLFFSDPWGMKTGVKCKTQIYITLSNVSFIRYACISVIHLRIREPWIETISHFIFRFIFYAFAAGQIPILVAGFSSNHIQQ